MDSLLREYLPILIFIAIAVALSVAIIAASFVVARQIGRASCRERV